MTTKQPTLGDRVVFHNPICEADRFGTVIAKRETRFGIDFEVQLDDAPTEVKHFSHYVGTAEDRGGYCHTHNHGGIGAYLVTANATEHTCSDDLPPGWAICEARDD